MKLRIISVKSKDKRASLLQLKALSPEENKEYQYIVSEGTYREIGCPLSGEILEDEESVRIISEDERRRAFAKLLRILEYADNNLFRTRQKLKAAGFGKDATDYALKEALRYGYINEKRQLSVKIEALANRKLLGPNRIGAKLSAEGYSRADIRDVLEELVSDGVVDFEKNKETLLEKLCPDGFEEKRKILYKYGFWND